MTFDKMTTEETKEYQDYLDKQEIENDPEYQKYIDEMYLDWYFSSPEDNILGEMPW